MPRICVLNMTAVVCTFPRKSNGSAFIFLCASGFVAPPEGFAFFCVFWPTFASSHFCGGLHFLTCFAVWYQGPPIFSLGDKPFFTCGAPSPIPARSIVRSESRKSCPIMSYRVPWYPERTFRVLLVLAIVSYHGTLLPQRFECAARFWSILVNERTEKGTPLPLC